MKQYLSTSLALVCVVLVVSLIMVKRSDNAQHESDIGSITDYSNRLDSAQTQIAICNGTIGVLSNSLDESRSAASVFSNQLSEAQSNIALYTEQITNLNRQFVEARSENQTLQTTLNQRVMELTNQITALTGQIALTQSNLDLANKGYALLENRFRRDVAERLVVERKFRNPDELKAQLQNVKNNPFTPMVSAESIYAGLDVEVKSNAVHVISPN